MSETIEEKPLHEIVLDILYYEDIEKPALMTPEDIFLIIKDPEVSERKIREVLEWLIPQNKVVKQFGKYQLDKYEFIDRANLEKERQKSAPKTRKKPSAPRSPRRIAIEKAPPPQKKQPWRKWVAVSFLLLALALLIHNVDNVHKRQAPELVQPQLDSLETIDTKRMYLSSSFKEDEAEFPQVKRRLKDVSYLFHLQEEHNKSVKMRTDSLFSQIKALEKYTVALENELKNEHHADKQLIRKTLIAIGLIIIGAFFLKKS